MKSEKDTGLENAIKRIRRVQDRISTTYTGELFNFKKTEVRDMFSKDSNIKENYLNSLSDYRSWLNANTEELLLLNYDLKNDFNQSNLDIWRINQRIKAPNSVYEKLYRYYHKDEEGKIIIKKCLNDYFGVRLIISEDTFDEDCINNTLDSLKTKHVINRFYSRKKDGYHGIHIAVNAQDNLRFPWEVQIWNSYDFDKNMKAHEKHKAMTSYLDIPKHYATKMIS